MNIAIIGSGNVGGSLAIQWLKAGHNVVVGAQFPLSEKNKQLATQIGNDKFITIEEATIQSDVILIATPPIAILEIVKQLKDVSNKVIIDATNSVAKMPEPYKNVYECLVNNTTAAVVKCFNTTGFENMLNPIYTDEKIDMFMAGDSPKAKQIAEQLALDCGFGSCIDFGKSDKVELLEKFALVWINLAIMQGYGRDIAFCLKRR